MADDFVQLPPDSTGKLMRTIKQTVGVNVTEAEVVHIASPTNASGITEVNSSGQLSVSISGQPVTISGNYVATTSGGTIPVSIVSGGRALISGDAVSVSGDWVNISGQAVSVSGDSVYVSSGLVGVVDAAGVRMPAMDVASRKGYVAITDGSNQLTMRNSDTGSTTQMSLNSNAYMFAANNALSQWQLVRTVQDASGTVGQGVLGVALLGWNGTNFEPIRTRSGYLVMTS